MVLGGGAVSYERGTPVRGFTFSLAAQVALTTGTRPTASATRERRHFISRHSHTPTLSHSHTLTLPHAHTPTLTHPHSHTPTRRAPAPAGISRQCPGRAATGSHNLWLPAHSPLSPSLALARARARYLLERVCCLAVAAAGISAAHCSGRGTGTLHPEPWTMNPEPWTLNPEPWTLNPAFWTLNPGP